MLSLLLLLSVSAPVAAPAPAAKRVLVIMQTDGYRHSSLDVAEVVLGRLAMSDSRIALGFSRHALEILKTKDIYDWDGIAFINTSGDFGADNLRFLKDYVKSGKAFIAVHGGVATYWNGQKGTDPQFAELIGASFDGHGKQSTGTLHLEGKGIRSGLKDGKVLFEEFYHFKESGEQIRKGSTVLASLQRQPMDGRPGEGKARDMPMAWVRQYGKGRVFSTALGHREDIWQSEWYREHLLGGILWALDLEGKA